MKGFTLKPDFQLGVATASAQIEGGAVASNWHDWFRKGRIKDGSNPARANDHYNRYEEDTALMASMGISIYRFGIEWSRIEPEEGVFSLEALSHYREEIRLLRKNGIEPLLTLHHFSHPMWFENKGGFENTASVDIFLRYLRKVIDSLGDLVNEYITINEPNVYTIFSYYYGVWPPGKASLRSTVRVYRNLTCCHIEAYRLIHQIRLSMGYSDTKVSFANHMRIFKPACSINPYHRFCAALMRRMFQSAVTRAMSLGKGSFPIFRLRGLSPGRYYDFIALNYYSRSTVSGFNDGVADLSPINDLGWEIYPEGLIRCAETLFRQYRAPIYITENGTCDNSDSFRCRFIYDHLKCISESSLPIQRYYHWCFIDNFEWLEGESARFGLVHVDYPTQVRTVKRSGEFFSKIIREKGVTEELFFEYANQEYQRSSQMQSR